MRLMAERLALLQECDLSESQARVYVALLDYPSETASNLAKLSRLPRNRLYEVLEELNALGLVDILIEEPRRYVGRPVAHFLDRCAADLRMRLERLEARRAYLVAAFEPRERLTPADLDRGVVQAIMGRRAVADRIDRLIAEARGELVLAGSSGGALRLAKHLLEAAPLREGVKVELYAPIAAAGGGGWERLLDAGVARVRWLRAPRATLAVVRDGEEMILVHPLPDDARTRAGQDYGLFTSNLAVIHDELQGVRGLPLADAPAEARANATDAAPRRART